MNGKPIILIVDDTPDNIAVLREILKDSYKIKIANNGVRALEMATAMPAPDLILLDIMMPEMDATKYARASRPMRRPTKSRLFF